MCTNEKISVKNAINSIFDLKLSAFFRFNVCRHTCPSVPKSFFSEPRQCKCITNTNFCQLFLQKLQRKIRHFFALLLCKTVNIRKNQQYGAFTDTNKPVSRRISLGLPGFKTIYLFPTIPRTTYQCCILLSWR